MSRSCLLACNCFDNFSPHRTPNDLVSCSLLEVCVVVVVFLVLDVVVVPVVDVDDDCDLTAGRIWFVATRSF